MSTPSTVEQIDRRIAELLHAAETSIRQHKTLQVLFGISVVIGVVLLVALPMKWGMTGVLLVVDALVCAGVGVSLQESDARAQEAAAEIRMLRRVRAKLISDGR